jgi:hypothetical protein
MPCRGVTRERIGSAALDGEREGPAALGIRRAARELEVTPMALYRSREKDGSELGLELFLGGVGQLPRKR